MSNELSSKSLCCNAIIVNAQGNTTTNYDNLAQADQRCSECGLVIQRLPTENKSPVVTNFSDMTSEVLLDWATKEGLTQYK